MKLSKNWQKKIKFQRPQTINEWKELVNKYPIITICLLGMLIYIGILVFIPPHKPDLSLVPKQQKPKIEGVKEAVDPRAAWSDAITQDIKLLKDDLQTTVSQQKDATFDEIKALNNKINDLKAILDNLQNTAPKDSTNQNNIEQEKPAPKIKHVMGFVHRDYDERHKKQPENYVTSGSFVRAVLLTGVVADTGTDAAGTPQPILLRLVDEGIFSKGYKTKQIKEAIIIGACHGNISSERALCRLEKLSLMNKEGQIVERPVEGWLIGEDGRPGIKGEVVDKASDVARMAVLNGILGGISNYFQNQATAGIYPISAISGQSKALVGTDALKAGGASGIGNALQKLAEYAIKRAEQMSPVIIIGSGRVIDVVFKSGFELKDLTSPNDPVKSGTSFFGKNLNQSSSSNHLTNSGSDRRGRAAGYKEGMKSLKDLQLQEGDF